MVLLVPALLFQIDSLIFTMFGFADVVVIILALALPAQFVVFNCVILVSIFRVDLLSCTMFGFTDVMVDIFVLALPAQIVEMNCAKFAVLSFEIMFLALALLVQVARLTRSPSTVDLPQGGR